MCSRQSVIASCVHATGNAPREVRKRKSAPSSQQKLETPKADNKRIGGATVPGNMISAHRANLLAAKPPLPLCSPPPLPLESPPQLPSGPPSQQPCANLNDVLMRCGIDETSAVVYANQLCALGVCNPEDLRALLSNETAAMKEMREVFRETIHKQHFFKLAMNLNDVMRAS